ncbi:MAG TPA: alpha/beta hydrolase [Solirubrobacteraceae bacterium]|nr:alpha/beta hydrolase [Solirubrobacteraceae bacterium]
MTSLALRIARSALHRPATRHRYGEHPRQVADLHRPVGPGPFPVVVVLHGGYWQQPYTKLVMRPLCVDLVQRGYAAFNIEYRRLGREGGGWPQTFDDVATAIDHLAGGGMRDARLDLARVTLLGHSAGGQLALWAAGRPELPADAPGGAPRVVATRVLALAAVSDLESAGRPARMLLGGSPDEVPERWRQADPMRRIPLGVPVGLVHSIDDETVSVQRSRDYAAAAAAAGADVSLAETEGGHRDPIDPVSRAWNVAAGWLEG